MIQKCLFHKFLTIFNQSARAVEYTDCISAEGKDPPPNECPGNDTKQNDGDLPVMLDLWGMQSILLLPLVPSQLTTCVEAPDRVLSMDLNCVLMLN